MARRRLAHFEMKPKAVQPDYEKWQAVDAILYFLRARLTPKMNWWAAVWGYLWPTVTVLILGFVSIALYMPFGGPPPSPDGGAVEKLDSR